MADWPTIESAPQDGTMLNLYCPGISSPTGGVLQGSFDTRLRNWTLNPYGTTSFTTLFPTHWCSIETPPA